MTKVIMEFDKYTKPIKKRFFIRTRKLARQALKEQQGNNRIKNTWSELQQEHGAGFWNHTQEEQDND